MEFKVQATVGITEDGQITIESNVENKAQLINLLAEGIQIVVIGEEEEK